MKSKSRKNLKSKDYFSVLINAIGKVNLIVLIILLLPFIWLTKVFWGIENKPLFWENHTQFDLVILDWIHQAIPDWIGKILIFIYQVTGAEVTAFIVAGSMGFLLWKRLRKEAAVAAVLTMGVLLVHGYIIKPFFFRLRPPDWLVHVDGRSFPSGHVTGNSAFYFYLAFLLAFYFPHRLKYFYGGAILMLFMIGLSSIYVRVHWLTDILAGYALGYIWVILAVTLLKLIEPKYNRIDMS